MPYFNYNGIALSGIATAIPDWKVKVESFIPTFGKDMVHKFMLATGIHSFYKSLPEQTASDLGFVAADYLLEEKRINRNNIGALVFVTQSPDYRRPATACVLQKRLGLSTNCAALDVNLGCSAFVYGLQVVCSMLHSSDMNYALLVLGETASKLTSPKDKATAMIFGDAGAALLLEKKDSDSFPIRISLKSDGYRYRSIILPAGGFRDMNPPRDSFRCSDGNERTLYDIFMDGTEVFSFSITDVPKSIFEFLEYTNTTVDEYDCFALHQANEFIIRQLMRKFKMSEDKVPLVLDKYGNTGGVSIPLALSSCYGKESEGTIRILMCGFGIGLSWGVASATIAIRDILPVMKTRDYYSEGKIKPGML